MLRLPGRHRSAEVTSTGNRKLITFLAVNAVRKADGPSGSINTRNC